MAETGTATQDGRATRSPSHFSDKQILGAAKRGKTVSVVLPNGEEVEGWICGMDAFHWGIVSANGDVTLIHKSAPSLRIGDSIEMTELARKVAEPFQRYASDN